MIKNIRSSEIKKYLKENQKIVVLDVRTEDEWKAAGKPISDILGVKIFFITINQDPSFINRVKKSNQI